MSRALPRQLPAHHMYIFPSLRTLLWTTSLWCHVRRICPKSPALPRPSHHLPSSPHLLMTSQWSLATATGRTPSTLTSWSPAPAAHATSPAQMRAPVRGRLSMHAPVRRALGPPALKSIVRSPEGALPHRRLQRRLWRAPALGALQIKGNCGAGTDQPCTGPAYPETLYDQEPCKQAIHEVVRDTAASLCRASWLCKLKASSVSSWSPLGSAEFDLKLVACSSLCWSPWLTHRHSLPHVTDYSGKHCWGPSCS